MCHVSAVFFRHGGGVRQVSPFPVQVNGGLQQGSCCCPVCNSARQAKLVSALVAVRHARTVAVYAGGAVVAIGAPGSGEAVVQVERFR